MKDLRKFRCKDCITEWIDSVEESKCYSCGAVSTEFDFIKSYVGAEMNYQYLFVAEHVWGAGHSKILSFLVETKVELDAVWKVNTVWKVNDCPLGPARLLQIISLGSVQSELTEIERFFFWPGTCPDIEVDRELIAGMESPQVIWSMPTKGGVGWEFPIQGY